MVLNFYEIFLIISIALLDWLRLGFHFPPRVYKTPGPVTACNNCIMYPIQLEGQAQYTNQNLSL